MNGCGGAKWWKGVVLAIVAQGWAGCSTPSWLCVAPGGPHTITLIADPSANGDAAITVDLVFISDQLVAEQVAALPAHVQATTPRSAAADPRSCPGRGPWSAANGRARYPAASPYSHYCIPTAEECPP